MSYSYTLIPAPIGDENKREGAAIESGLRWLEDRSNSMIGIAGLIEMTSQ